MQNIQKINDIIVFFVNRHKREKDIYFSYNLEVIKS